MRCQFKRVALLAGWFLLLSCSSQCAWGQANAPDNKNDPLIAELQADFEALLKKEANPRPLIEAAKYFAQTNQSSRWTYYGNALRLLREHRSPAGVPLIMRYMVEHAHFGSFQHAAYVDTLAILTGKDLDDPYRYVAERVSPVRRGVEGWMRDWWREEKGKLSTDVGKMSRKQLEVVTSRLLKLSKKSSDYASGRHDFDVSRKLGHVLGTSHDRGPTWYRSETHPNMIPILLAGVGYEEKPNAKPPQWETNEVGYAAIPILSFIRANGGAPELHRIAADSRQNSAVRLTCLLAVYKAGEPMPTKPLTEMFAREKKLERKLIIVYALPKSAEVKSAVPLLIELLTDKNRYVRGSALDALGEYTAPQALPHLAEILKKSRDSTTIRQALRIVGKIQTREAANVLAEFMKEALTGGSKFDHAYDALSAFEQATGKTFREAGAHPNEYYRQRATEALAWWKAQRN